MYVYLGEAIGKNPGYLKLRKIRAAQNIARTVKKSIFHHTRLKITIKLFYFQIANSQNRVYLSGNSLMLNISDKEFDDLADKMISKK